MAPRPIEPLDAFIARLRRASPWPPAPRSASAATTSATQWWWRTAAGACARWCSTAPRPTPLKERGYFMPENAEDLSEPGDPVELEADSLDDLIMLLKAGQWPL
ncbi:hypothetical protein [Nannocystis pusilla]|uniref:hypothetical protein n=1 Tax=Nannocystis pusilla TaxID=889268 RepID=UPI003B793FF3